MILLYSASNDLFIFKCTFRDRNYPKKAGFNYNVNIKCWYTNDYYKALALYDYANNTAKEKLDEYRESLKQRILDSKVKHSDIKIPKPDNGMDYFPYQRAGIQFGHEKDKIFMFDDMGTGKTIMSTGIVNMADKKPKSVVIICPNSVKYQWEKEWKSWTVHNDLSVKVQHSNKMQNSDVMIFNYEVFSTPTSKSNSRYKELKRAGKFNASEVALNMIKQQSKTIDFLIIDEAHRLKNWSANTTKNIFKLKGMSEKIILLTGSPVMNNPSDLWTLLRFVDEHKNYAEDKNKFLIQYCGGEWNSFAGGIKSNLKNIDPLKLEELQIKLRTSIMIRRTKQEVFPDMPPKIRSVVPVEVDNSLFKEFDDLNSLLSDMTDLNADASTSVLSGLRPENIAEFTELRKLTGRAKVKPTVEYIKDNIPITDKVLIFCQYHDTIDLYKQHFASADIISGKVSAEQREIIKENFQKDKLKRYLILQMDAGGVGLNLTSANHVVFAELHVVPKIMEQCEDRANRYGQDKTVYVHVMVAEGTADASLGNLIVGKIKASEGVTELENLSILS
jgi:SWI/SNF-related matrix-associated actin-dependent regulator of chromatin subfamily A-like protein 1